MKDADDCSCPSHVSSLASESGWLSHLVLKQALALAERANQLSGDNNPAVLRTLAAAYAENGRFTEARVTAERGLQLANAQEKPAMANVLERDLARYRSKTPVRTATQPGPDSSSSP